MRVSKKLIAVVASILPLTAMAAEAGSQSSNPTITIGISGISLLANISYAGMRAQGHKSQLWRIISFIFGFPGTLITFLVVREGSERAYGIELPRKNNPRSEV